jgi:hypothetical protein
MEGWRLVGRVHGYSNRAAVEEEEKMASNDELTPTELEFFRSHRAAERGTRLVLKAVVSLSPAELEFFRSRGWEPVDDGIRRTPVDEPEVVEIKRRRASKY